MRIIKIEEITINKKLGAKLRKERINRDVTQKILGINIGVSHQQIRKYEKALKNLYMLAEESGNNSKENRLLIVSFTMGLMIQVKEKLNTLEDGLGCEYARVMYLTIESNSKIVERDAEGIVGGEKSIRESPLELNTNNFNDAVNYLSKKISNEIYNALCNRAVGCFRIYF